MEMYGTRAFRNGSLRRSGPVAAPRRRRAKAHSFHLSTRCVRVCVCVCVQACHREFWWKHCSSKNKRSTVVDQRRGFQTAHILIGVERENCGHLDSGLLAGRLEAISLKRTFSTPHERRYSRRKKYFCRCSLVQRSARVEAAADHRCLLRHKSAWRLSRSECRNLFGRERICHSVYGTEAITRLPCLPHIKIAAVKLEI